MELAEYDKKLSYMDWYFDYSDDHRVYTAGRQKLDNLIEISKESSEHMQLYKAWADFQYQRIERDELDSVRMYLKLI